MSRYKYQILDISNILQLCICCYEVIQINKDLFKVKTLFKGWGLHPRLFKLLMSCDTIFNKQNWWVWVWFLRQSAQIFVCVVWSVTTEMFLVNRYFLGTKLADCKSLPKKHQHTSCLKSEGRHGPKRGLNPWPPDNKSIDLPTELPDPI